MPPRSPEAPDRSDPHFLTFPNVFPILTRFNLWLNIHIEGVVGLFLLCINILVIGRHHEVRFRRYLCRFFSCKPPRAFKTYQDPQISCSPYEHSFEIQTFQAESKCSLSWRIRSCRQHQLDHSSRPENLPLIFLEEGSARFLSVHLKDSIGPLMGPMQDGWPFRSLR